MSNVNYILTAISNLAEEHQTELSKLNMEKWTLEQKLKEKEAEVDRWKQACANKEAELQKVLKTLEEKK